jgi:hypothetical protein
MLAASSEGTVSKGTAWNSRYVIWEQQLLVPDAAALTYKFLTTGAVLTAQQVGANTQVSAFLYKGICLIV